MISRRIAPMNCDAARFELEQAVTAADAPAAYRIEMDERRTVRWSGTGRHAVQVQANEHCAVLVGEPNERLSRGRKSRLREACLQSRGLLRGFDQFRRPHFAQRPLHQVYPAKEE